MYRPITITAVLNGFMATVGCQTVVFQTVDSLLAELGAYLRNPEETEKRYQSMPNARHTLQQAILDEAVQRVEARNLEQRAVPLNQGPLAGLSGVSTPDPRNNRY